MAAIRKRRRKVLDRVVAAQTDRDADALLPEIDRAFDDAPNKGATARWALGQPPARRRALLQKELPEEMADEKPLGRWTQPSRPAPAEGPPKPGLKPKPPGSDLTPEHRFHNTRSLDYFRTRSRPGDYARFVAADLEAGGAERAKALDLLGRLPGTNPELADRLTRQVHDRLTPETRAQVFGGEGDTETGPPSVPFWPERAPSGDTLDPPRHAPVPRYKESYLKATGQEQNWKDFQDAVGRLPGVTDAERTALREIYAAEGFSVNDEGSSGSSGVMANTLDAAKASGEVSGLEGVRRPSDLTATQRAKIMRWYFDAEFPRIGGHEVLNEVPNKYAAAALADTLYRHGGPDGTKIIQKAINKVDPNAVSQDRVFGSRTLAAYKRLSSEPRTRAKLLETIRDIRNRQTQNKETMRMNHFAFPDRR